MFAFVNYTFVTIILLMSKIDKTIDKRSIKILTLGINGTFPFVYSSVSRIYIMSNVNKYIIRFFKLVNK